jgi:hypothetical protein
VANAFDRSQRHRENSLPTKTDHFRRIAKAGSIDDLAAVTDAAERSGAFHALPCSIDDTT